MTAIVFLTTLAKILVTFFVLTWGSPTMAENHLAHLTVKPHSPAGKGLESPRMLPQESQEEIIRQLEGNTLQPELMLALIESRNPALMAARAQLEAVRMQFSQLEALQETLDVYGQYLTRPTGMGQGKAMIEKQYPAPGTMTMQNQVVQSAVRIADLNFRTLLRDQWVKALQNYHEAQFLERKINKLASNLQILHSLHKTVSSFFSTGKARLFSLLEVEIELAKLEEEHRVQQEDLAQLRVSLNLLMDLPPNLKWYWEPHPALPFHHLNIPEITEFKQLLELQQQREKLRQLELMTALETDNLIPALSDNLAIQGTRPTEPAGHASMEKQGLKPSPFFGTRSAYLEETRWKARAAQKKLAALENETQERLHSVVRLLRQTHRKLELYQQTLVPKAKEGVESVMSEYSVGRADLGQALRMQEKLLRAEIEWHAVYLQFRNQQLEHQVITNAPLKGDKNSTY